MNILFLTTGSESGIQNGASIRTSAILESLKLNNVRFLSCGSTFPLNPFTRLPLSYRKYYSDARSKQIEQVVNRENIQVVVADHLQTVPLVTKIRVRKILNLHNLESSLYLSLSRSEDFRKSSLFSACLKAESAMIKHLEDKHFPEFDTVIFPTSEEMNQSRLPVDRCITISNPAAPGSETLSSSGLQQRTFSTLCNPAWFFNRPQFRFICRQSRFIQGTFVKPVYLASLEEKLKNISMLLSWGTFQGGSKIKVITGLAAGIPQVITRLDNAGLNLKEGQGVLIAENRTDWLNKSNALLSDLSLKQSLSVEGRNLIIREGLTYSTIVKRFRDFFKLRLGGDFFT